MAHGALYQVNVKGGVPVLDQFFILVLGSNPWTQTSLNLRSDMGSPIFSSSELARVFSTK